MHAVDQRLRRWRSRPESWQKLLLEVFGRSEDVELRGISVELLDKETMAGLYGAYAPSAPDGDERIYLNADWLNSASVAEVEAVLLEELGHAIDRRLNDGNDSAGDEGAIFSALLRSENLEPAVDGENDQRILNIDGVDVAVEASTDTTRPTGSLGTFATAPAYAQEGGDEPFGIPDIDPEEGEGSSGGYPDPTLADIDKDGDLDLFIGRSSGDITFFHNTGTASVPAFTQAGGQEPFGITTSVVSSSPALADVDGDGDLDLFIGFADGYTRFFRNTGTAISPAYTQEGGNNPFNITDVGSNVCPALADIDADGDLDLFLGNDDGNTLFFRNTGTASVPAFTKQEGDTPFGITKVSSFASPDLVDIDGDGDLDLFIGNDDGNTLFFRNTGTASVPAFTKQEGDTPFGISDVGDSALPAFADIDDDGDLDLFIGEAEGNTFFFRNTATTPVAPVNATTANGTYGINDVITLTVGFSEPVVVNTSGGTPRLQLETGSTDRYATYTSGSGSSTLTFQYTVQEGDTSADLDQLSSSALELNGGTIKDAAGNNAILTLAAPGEAGSLGDNAVLGINSAPNISGASATLAFTEGDGAKVIDSSLTITDIDDSNIESATVTISSGFQSAEDVLAFSDTSAITGSWNESTGVLTLNGSDSLANYKAALESVTYNNNSENPNTANRTISWVVNDGDTDSSAATSTITVAAVNDAPTLSTAASPELTTINEDPGTPSGQVGTLVSALIDSEGSLNNFSDRDGDSPAIAIISTNLNDGTLYYSTNNGTSWSDVGTVSETSARVLYADSNTRLAFVPATDFTGTISDLITFKAWDRTGPTSISSTPTLTGTLTTSGSFFGVTLSADGNTAFVADQAGSLKIINVSNPASPALVGTYNTSGSAVDVTLSADDNTAFVADHSSGLQIIDVSNPASPSLTGNFDTSGLALGVTLSADGKKAFVADGEDGLDIINVSNPASPSLTGTYNTSGFAYDVTLSADGKTAFIADAQDGLQVIDITNLANPSLISTLNTSGYARAVSLSANGNTAIIADGNGGLQIINISNPASPSLTSTFNTSDYAYHVTLSADGNTAFVADDDEGLSFINISDLTNPTLRGNFNTSGSAYGVSISADGNTAYVADSSRLQIIDVVDPAANGSSAIATAPSLKGNFDTSDNAQGVVISADGSTAFIADASDGLDIINISDPTNPTLRGNFNTSGSANDVTLSADGKTAFIADDTSGLQIIDVSNPASPSLKATHETPSQAFGVTLSADGNTAFVASGGGGGLQILNVSDPASPTLTASYITPTSARDVSLSADGNTAFVADYTSGLQIIDISTLANPTLIGSFDTSGQAEGVSLSADGNTAFVADGTSGLKIIDVSDPTSPTLRGSNNTGWTYDISLSANGNTAFVAARDSGLQIIDVSNPASSTLISTLDTSGRAFGVTLSADSNTAFVADDESGLQIIDVSNTQSFSSDSDTAKIEVSNINDAPTGSVTISGTATQGQTLTASNTLADADGLGTIAYGWRRSGTAINIPDPSSTTYTLVQADVGSAISVTASYTDGEGTAESVKSDDTSAVANVNDLPTGSVTISGTPTQGQTLTAANTLADADGLGTISYQWKREGEAISGATSANYTLVQADVGSAISVTASYTDGEGTAESVDSDDTSAVANVNDLPTGSVTISGTPTQGQTLTASNTLADADGLGTIAYGWRRSGTAINIPDPSSTTYTLVQADVGSAISVTASYTDGEGTAESVDSDDTSAVANVNDLPTGSVTISGTPTQGQTLTASNTLADADGLGTISNQWKRAGEAISGATSANYTLVQADVGSAISVTASYTDGEGTAESVKSDDTSAVANVNDLPTGSVTISGTPTQGQTLTAANTLADADGLGTISNQWKRAGEAISGATSANYTLVQADVGSAISVTASYTDGAGTAESVKSDDTSAVANVNDLPTGSVTISGTPTQGQTLTAANTLADADGLGTISNQWKRAGEAISGATSANYTLVQADVGSAISVTASYTDGEGTAESVKSDDTSAVANVNDLPTGSVTISGTPTQGQTLTAANTLADADGLGTISNQWKRAGTAISGATSANYTLVQADVGSAISVTTSYTDGAGTVESVDSDDTSAVKALFTPTPASDKSSNDSSSSSSSSSSSDKRDSNTAQTIENSLINGRRYWTHNVDSLINQSDINYGLLNDDDYLEVTGGKNNFANGNNGDDHFIVFDSQDSQFLGGKGSDFFEVKGGTDNFFLGSIGEDTFKVSAGKSHISGGDDNDTIEVLGAIEGTFINGNRGNDLITGVAAGVIYRGGKDDDVLAVSQGDAWGDQGFDTFQGVSGDGYALIQDYTVGEDKIDLSMVQGGNWTNSENGLMYTDSSGDQIMLLVGIKNTEQVTLI
ncbi:FG-GAP-like repeat-containing protein [Synechococcus sp. MIT S9504]|uniref:FG-GAP-like repeat-containing protein n=1 Tax=Synechococcus sp. MIT S9504 TaxID=1801628 RepID=UPI0039C07892